MSPNTTFETNGLSFDLEAHAVSREGIPRYMREEYWEALMLLIRRKGKVVHKSELSKILGCTTDGSLTKHLQRIRETLGDTEKPFRVIKAQTSVGYRWIGQDISTIENELSAPAPTVYIHPNGSFHKKGQFWKEYRKDKPDKPFTFKELRRDGIYVYLYDESRQRDPGHPLYVRLPMSGGVAQWAYPNPLRWDDLLIVEPKLPRSFSRKRFQAKINPG